MVTVQTDGTQLDYIERGQGDPVVFVHGTLYDYRSWELQIDMFSETYRVVSYSRRYHCVFGHLTSHGRSCIPNGRPWQEEKRQDRVERCRWRSRT